MLRSVKDPIMSTISGSSRFDSSLIAIVEKHTYTARNQAYFNAYHVAFTTEIEATLLDW